MFSRILRELEHHAPFTALGAVGGVIIAFLFKGMGHDAAYRLFYFFHPLHVLLSAVVTTAIFRIHAPRKKTFSYVLKVFLIGYVGSVGIGTLSDSLIPFFGEQLLGLKDSHVHVGFIEEWLIVNPAAIAGIVIGYFLQKTKLPHSAHVLVSTIASLFHMLMALPSEIGIVTYAIVFLLLFVSVWLPCCMSDIAFPLLFVKGAKNVSCCCHSHENECES